MDGVISPDDATFARIGRDAARLRRLADDLSALSATAEPRLEVRAVQLDSLVDDIVDRLRPQADVKGLDLTVDHTFHEEGEAPPELLPRVMEGVVRRGGDEKGEPRAVEIERSAERYEELLGEFDAPFLREEAP